MAEETTRFWTLKWISVSGLKHFDAENYTPGDDYVFDPLGGLHPVGTLAFDSLEEARAAAAEVLGTEIGAMNLRKGELLDLKEAALSGTLESSLVEEDLS